MNEENKDVLKQKIGFRIKQLRVQKGWPRKAAADKLELSLASYGCIERGEVDMPITRLVEVAEIFGTDLEYLLESDGKIVFSINGNDNKGCNYYSKNSVSSDTKELQYELEKAQLIQCALEKENENLKKQIEQLEEINRLLKGGK